MEQQTPLVAIIDDELSIRTALQRLFRSTRYRAEFFASCAEFLKFSADHEPDCVVIDMQLPEMPGIELVRQLSARKNPPPMIVVTGDIEFRTKEECIALGTKYYLSKPFEGSVLLESVATIVESAR